MAYYEVFGRAGRVREVRRWNDTHLSASGGGGNAHWQRDISVRTTIVPKLELFGTDDSGADFHTELKHVSVGIASGHDITLIAARRKDQKKGTGTIYAVRNNSTGQEEILKPSLRHLTGSAGIAFWGWSIIGGFLGWLGAHTYLDKADKSLKAGEGEVWRWLLAPVPGTQNLLGDGMPILAGQLLYLLAPLLGLAVFFFWRLPVILDKRSTLRAKAKRLMRDNTPKAPT